MNRLYYFLVQLTIFICSVTQEAENSAEILTSAFRSKKNISLPETLS